MSNEIKNDNLLDEQVEHRELAPGVILYKEYRKVTDHKDIVGIFIWKVKYNNPGSNYNNERCRFRSPSRSI
jgi:hypothetical protein